MSEAQDDIRTRIADMIANLESQIRVDQGIIEAATDAQNQLIALDAAQEDVQQYAHVVLWAQTHLTSLQSLLSSARKLQNGDFSNG